MFHNIRLLCLAFGNAPEGSIRERFHYNIRADELQVLAKKKASEHQKQAGGFLLLFKIVFLHELKKIGILNLFIFFYKVKNISSPAFPQEKY